MNELKLKIEHLLDNNASNFEISKEIKEHLNRYYKTLPDTFKKSGGKDFLIKHTRKIDIVIKLIYKIATREMFGQYFPSKISIPLAVTALGSYGREQLSPKSDIDIMFVYKNIPGYNVVEIIEKMYYLLIDAGLKLGHRVHEIDELESVANSDITIKTAILEARFIDGSKFIWYEVENKINRIRHTNQIEFIIEKIEERRKLRAKYPLMMEPNLKEGVGGFRDANLVYWIGKVLHNAPSIHDIPTNIINEVDYKKFRVSLEFLFRVRSALHLVSKKKNDLLRLEYIPEIVDLLGWQKNDRTHLIFAKRVHKALRVIWLYSRIWVYQLIKDKIAIYDNYLKPDREFKDSTDALEFLIDNAKLPFRAHPKLHLALLHTPKSKDTQKENELILKMFQANYTSSILTLFLETNLLGTYITPMKKVIAWPQFDGYHKYPVDAHSIKTLIALENLNDPKLKKIYDALSPRYETLLKLATFLHDCGKGREIDHHILGEKIFTSFAKKLNLSEEDIKLGAKLIRYHGLLSQTAQKEDIYNPKVISKFTAVFPSKLELDMILLLTVADVSAVGANIYNDFTARLFETLYEHALEFLKHPEFLDEMSKRVKRVESLKRTKIFNEQPKILQKKILQIESNLPFIKYSNNRIIEIAKRALEVEDYACEITSKKFLTIEIIRKNPIDLGYLLSKLSKLNLVNMDIVKLFDGKKYFKIDFSQRVSEIDILDIKKIVKDSFSKQEPIKLPKPNISRDNITIDCNHTIEYALMRLEANDQKGMMAYLMNIFEKLNIEIVSSKIYTHKGRVHDIFLIEKNGNFCQNIDYIIEEFVIE